MSDAKSEINGSLVPVTKDQAMLMLEAGYLWARLGKVDSARELLNGAALLMPKSDVPHLALGDVEFESGDFAKALAAYRKAQQLAPKSSLHRARVGNALLCMGKANEAMKELKSAIDLGGDGAQLAQELISLKELGAVFGKEAPAKK